VKGLNKAYLIGHIGQDPELRTTAGGKQLLKLSLATPNARKVNEEWIDTPDWHRVTAWDRDAEYLARYAHKGDLLAVECTIRPNKWIDKDEVMHYDVELYVDRVLSLHGKTRPAKVRDATSDIAPTSETVARAGEDLEEIPF